MKYLIQFEKSVQITEDSWRIERPSLEITEDKTIAEVLKWVMSVHNRFPEKIEIRELQSLPK